jgi:hypothetical protein
VPLAVNVADVATPAEFVVAVLALPAKDPLAPFDGAAKVTVTPVIGLFDASLTVTTSGLAKAVLISALCGLPLVTTIDAELDVFDKAKVAGVAIPGARAVTV